MLDLDEMKQHWAEQDRKLDESIRLNRQLLSLTNLNQARSALRHMTVLLTLEAIVWFVIVVALGNFLYAHMGSLRFAVPGAMLDAYATGMLAATIALIVSARQIDYSRPVATIQKQIEGLRVLRIRITQWGVLAGTVVWAPFVIVISRVLFGLNDYSTLWFWANVALGLSLIALALWLAKRYGERMGQSPFIQRLMNDIAGRNLIAARTFLAGLTEFENEGFVPR
jgi:hypothetical protein